MPEWSNGLALKASRHIVFVGSNPTLYAIIIYLKNNIDEFIVYSLFFLYNFNE